MKSTTINRESLVLVEISRHRTVAGGRLEVSLELSFASGKPKDLYV